MTESINRTGTTGRGDNDEPMPRRLKRSAFNEHRIFISYTSQNLKCID